jgi:hypothetical protein
VTLADYLNHLNEICVEHPEISAHAAGVASDLKEEPHVLFFSIPVYLAVIGETLLAYKEGNREEKLKKEEQDFMVAMLIQLSKIEEIIHNMVGPLKFKFDAEFPLEISRNTTKDDA